MYLAFCNFPSNKCTIVAVKSYLALKLIFFVNDVLVRFVIFWKMNLRSITLRSTREYAAEDNPLLHRARPGYLRRDYWAALINPPREQKETEMFGTDDTSKSRNRKLGEADETCTVEDRSQRVTAVDTERSAQRRKVSLKKKRPQTCGSGGHLAAHIQARVSKLDASPLAEPVFSPGRRAYIGTADSSLPRPSSTRACNSTPGAPPRTRAPSSAGRRRRKQQCSGDVGVNQRALGRDPPTARPATALGLSRSSRQERQHQQCTDWNPDIPSPQPAVPPPPACGIRAESNYVADPGASTVAAPRPATAPPRGGGEKRKITSASPPSGRRCASSSSVGRRPSSFLSRSKKEEVRLLEKLNKLSGPHHRGEYPTICELKRAVAIEVVHAQLRKQRGGGRRKEVDSVAPRGSDASSRVRRSSAAPGASPAVRSGENTTDSGPSGPRRLHVVSRAVGLASTAAERSSTRRGRRSVGTGSRSPARRRAVPWDNRTPFVRTEMSPFREKCTPTPRAFTANNPAFMGGTPSRRNHRPRSACSTSRRAATRGE